jgi:hypothetical protein
MSCRSLHVDDALLHGGPPSLMPLSGVKATTPQLRCCVQPFDLGVIPKVLNSPEDAHVSNMINFESMSVFAGLLCG